MCIFTILTYNHVQMHIKLIFRLYLSKIWCSNFMFPFSFLNDRNIFACLMDNLWNAIL